MWIKSNILIHCVLIYVTQCDDNVDIFEPIMRPSPEVNVTKEDLFGYKIALHRINLPEGISNAR